MPKQSALEREIEATGAIQYGDFTAANGEQGNLKVVLDPLLNDPQYKELRTKVVKKMAEKLSLFDPEVIIPMPEGANNLGIWVARELGARAILMEWENKPAGKLRYIDQHERIVVCRASRIGFVDDVYRTGHTFEQMIVCAELEGKALEAAVVHDRSGRNHHMGFPVHAAVKRYLPMMVDAPQ